MDTEQLPAIVITFILIGILVTVGIVIFTNFDTGTRQNIPGIDTVTFTSGSSSIPYQYCGSVGSWVIP